MPKKPAPPVKRQDTKEVQGVQVVVLCSQGLSYAKIVQQSGGKKTTCFDIVKLNEECREPDRKTPYTF